MKTELTKYLEIKIGDKIFYKEKDHERRKLGFNEIETVINTYYYLSKGAGILVNIQFLSGNGTLGFLDAFLNKVIEE